MSFRNNNIMGIENFHEKSGSVLVRIFRDMPVWGNGVEFLLKF
ncbi:hypothetical protein THEYE_A1102 [Thermodesulfovibrio yellowstonii DSM 11347]|uniref:Uncharacterized protein n=1 Tax=Thermodesulfovibrio yellowstonii (strain ATCC 51303 / DSM 11347 / YP87) TaxID=289376 RepID=B5YL11_THEYD|nr:hypothetical protein THEYE_A1102 [Thermodesulfovibrio yellowstonii DSM 11347]